VGDVDLPKFVAPTCIGSVCGRSVRILTMMQSLSGARSQDTRCATKSAYPRVEGRFHSPKRS
jgi:hypothetical protein